MIISTDSVFYNQNKCSNEIRSYYLNVLSHESILSGDEPITVFSKAIFVYHFISNDLVWIFFTQMSDNNFKKEKGLFEKYNATITLIIYIKEQRSNCILYIENDLKK